MARSTISDLLQVFPFWLCDAGPVDPLGLPILTPIFGFSAISAPEIVAEPKEIAEGNWYFTRKVVKRASVSNMVLERGVVFYDSDFWRWMMTALTGDMSSSQLGIPGTPLQLSIGGTTPRRSLLLVQFFTRMPFSLPAGSEAAIEAGIMVAGQALGSSGDMSAASFGGGISEGIVVSALASSFGPFEFLARLPAKAWSIHGAIPVRYKAGSDFDASSSAVSLQQLELAVEMIEEVSLVA